MPVLSASNARVPPEGQEVAKDQYLVPWVYEAGRFLPEKSIYSPRLLISSSFDRPSLITQAQHCTHFNISHNKKVSMQYRFVSVLAVGALVAVGNGAPIVRSLVKHSS
jgi:hypothetical protein